jgi:hypothetical protein
MTYNDQLSFGGMPQRQPQLRKPKHAAGPEKAPQAPESFQPMLQPIAGTQDPHFAKKGIGKYVNPRNGNGNQFNRPAVKGALVSAVRAHNRAQYFRHAGFGAAIRHVLDIEQVPSHQTDYMNAQRRMEGKRQNGINPSAVYGAVDPRKPYEPWGETEPEA